MKKTDPHMLVPMDLFADVEPISIDIVYAHPNHPENIFGTAIYHSAARLSLHRDLAAIVLRAARKLHRAYGWTLVLKDGLRPVEAQTRMMHTPVVMANPRWLEPPGQLLSRPGQGAHPRGMAIDVSVKGVDMGTVFDSMTPESARDYTGFSAEILANRKKLESAFVESAAEYGLPLLPLPSEWWDFRFPASFYEGWDAFSEDDLPGPLKMLGPTNNDAMHFDRLKKDVLNMLGNKPF
jgi:zinc D-Ala-D-Ala dipeptidase